MYLHCFCTWRKREKQTHLEFLSDLVKHFDCWVAAMEVNDYNGLRELIVLEQFKDTLPEHVADYISDQKVNTALADEYVLWHKCAFGERRSFGQQQ